MKAVTDQGSAADEGRTAVIPPLRTSVTVAVAPERAFDVFTQEIGQWWPLARYSIGGQRAEQVVLERRVGGRIYEIWDDGSEHEWGRILTWEPSERLVYSWHPGRSAEAATEVEVRFGADGEGTLVEVEQRHWERFGAEAEEMRASYESGWPAVLGAYAGHSRS